VTWLSGLGGRHLDQTLASKQDYDDALELGEDGPPDFVATVLHTDLWPAQRSVGFWNRIIIACFNIQQRLGIRYPARTWIGVSTNQEWRVYEGLGQCTQITGKRYLLAREGVRRTVVFGINAFPPTVTGKRAMVNGVQWVAAFEQTLRTNGWVLSPAWGGVKVIPKDKVEKYQRAGLVKVRI
jgi:hypothetical protein